MKVILVCITKLLLVTWLIMVSLLCGQRATGAPGIGFILFDSH